MFSWHAMTLGRCDKKASKEGKGKGKELDPYIRHIEELDVYSPCVVSIDMYRGIKGQFFEYTHMHLNM